MGPVGAGCLGREGVLGSRRFAPIWNKLDVRGNRTVIAVAALAVAAIVVFVLFGDQIGRRALPPQATAPKLPEAARPNGAPPGAPAPGAETAFLVRPSFDVVRVSRDCTAVIAGRAAPGALVTVKTPEGEIGRVTADARGEWAMVPDLPLKGGTRELGLSAELPGQKAVESDSVVVVVVPDCRPGQPVSGEQVIAVLTPQHGASRLLQVPGDERGLPQARGLSLDTVDYDEKGELVLSGRAAPNSTVQTYVNNQPVGTAIADAKGRWQLQLSEAVPPGVYTLRIDQVEEAGKVASRLELPFSRASRAEIDFSAGNVVVQPGNSLWRIARRIYGEGPKYTIIYRANQDQIRDPDLIYPGQIFALPKPEEPQRTN